MASTAKAAAAPTGANSSAPVAASAAISAAMANVRVLAEFDHRVVADQIVDGGGLDVDAGDRRPLEAGHDRLAFARTARLARAFKSGGKALSNSPQLVLAAQTELVRLGN
jgi:hypothetical protein